MYVVAVDRKPAKLSVKISKNFELDLIEFEIRN